MNELQKQITEIQEKHAELVEVRENFFSDKNDITIRSVGILLSKVEDGISELLEGIAKKDYYDKSLGEAIKDSISEVAKAFSQIQLSPEVNVTPNINVDLKPLQSIAGEISNQNKTLLGLIEKMNKGDNSQDVYRLVVGMVKKNNDFLEQAFKEIDYTSPLNEIGVALNKPEATEWKIKVTKRLGGGAFEEAVITTIK